MCRKITLNFLIQYICLRKETALQNLLSYNFALLSPARFSEFVGENSLTADAFSKKIFQQEENFPLTG